jgi:hypothetical protein
LKGKWEVTVVVVGLVDLKIGRLSCHRRRRRLGTLVARDELCGSEIESARCRAREARPLRKHTCSNSESSIFVIFVKVTKVFV